jgi:LysR family transcriptional regulator, glycine cleavage system transcriptional activator
MRTLPPLTELRSFEAAARHLSFKAAAAELAVTPTAISHQIKLLEQHCGQPLFQRRPRPLSLTFAGEALFLAVRNGFDGIAEGLASVKAGAADGRLRVTTTNAFAARWLVPRLPLWRAAYPRIRLDIIGTDVVLDLEAGEADVAIRYAKSLPLDASCGELMRDTFHVMASPRLIGEGRGLLAPNQLAEYPLIEAEWPPSDLNAPNWRRWQVAAETSGLAMPDLAALATLSFREELHAIEAAVAGQGVAICSDVLTTAELASGGLVKVSSITLPGYGFYIARRASRAPPAAVAAFVTWALAVSSPSRRD